MAAPALATDVLPVTHRPALAALGGATLIGFLAALFIPEYAWGLGFPVFMLGSFGVAVYVRRFALTPQGKGAYALWGMILAFSLLVAWRDALELRTLNLLMAALLVGILAIRSGPASLGKATVYDYPFRALGAWFMGFVDTFSLLMADIAWRLIPVGARGKHLGAVFRGLIIATPLLLIFGALFANADAGFEKLVTNAFSFDGETLALRIFIGLVFGWMAAGFFRRMYVAPPPPPVAAASPTPETRLGGTEIGIVLGSLNLLFLLFVSTQWRYFFGGAEVIHATANLNVADFARRGFFELVAVTGLSLPILLGFHALVDPQSQGMRRLYKWLGGVMVVLLAIVMQSAYMKLQLYMDSFGLTTLRLYVGACLVWLALVFGWFAMTILSERSNRFAWGAVVTLAAAVLGLNVLNPDRFVAEWTLRHQTPEKIDWSYLSELSADATPVLVEAWPKVPQDSRAAFANGLSRFKTGTDWRSSNLSLEAARNLGPHRAEISKAAEGYRVEPESTGYDYYD